MRALYLLAAMALYCALPGHSLADVRCIQQFLSDTGFDPGPVDGAWGRKTQGALEEAMAQLGTTVEGGLQSSNSDAICNALTADPETAEFLSLRIYPITLLKPGQDDRLTDRTAFDFSKVAVAADANFERCSFRLMRRVFDEPGTQLLATGNGRIDDGYITIERAMWFTDGLSDDFPLAEGSNLAITTKGQVVGRMVYFERFITAGEVDEAPIYVTLSDKFEVGSSGFPNGESSFPVNVWSEASITLTCAPK